MTGSLWWVLHEDVVAEHGEKKAARIWDGRDAMCFGREQAWVDGRVMTCAEAVCYAIGRSQPSRVGVQWWKQAQKTGSTKTIDPEWSKRKRQEFEATLRDAEEPAAAGAPQGEGLRP